VFHGGQPLSNQCLQDGKTPLYMATACGDATVVAQLLAVPAIDVNAADEVTCPGTLNAGLLSFSRIKWTCKCGHKIPKV
jgi:hypothetical protein